MLVFVLGPPIIKKSKTYKKKKNLMNLFHILVTYRGKHHNFIEKKDEKLLSCEQSRIGKEGHLQDKRRFHCGNE